MTNFDDLGSPEKALTARSSMLSTLCVLSFIGSGLTFISYLYFLFNIDTLLLEIQTEEIYESIAGLKDMMEKMLAPGFWFFFSLCVVSLASLVGTWFMWKLKKKGFHIYTIAQIIGICMPLVFSVGQGIPYAGIFWSALFVFLYWREIKKISQVN